ncbi:branched-chain amino acid ABC transporter permease [Planosporangium flavigriseum]|nr:branched-chain amino acid ABC transporter permease [Planosporangium flavigriseum]NJC66223.1 branched-chain amino acid ABC transporter permease [Planosporangium flavigriseum]
MKLSFDVLRKSGPFIIGAVLVIVMALLPMLNIVIPGVLPGPTYQPGSLALLSLCMVYAAMALSYNLLLGTSGLLSFGHALYFGAGAYGLGILLSRTGLPFWVSTGVGLVGGLALALLSGAVALRTVGIAFAMVTLAFAQTGSLFVSRSSSLTGGEDGITVNTMNVPAAFVGILNTKNLYWLALVVLVLVYLVALWVDKSRLGHVAAATRENELRLRVLGLRPFTTKLIVFAIAGLMAAAAGMVYLLLQSGVGPKAVNYDLTVTILVMVVLGGVGYRWGAIVGGFVYTLLDQRLTALAQSDAVDSLPAFLRVPLSQPHFLLGIVFILIVMFSGGGIAGTVDSRIRRRDWRRAAEAALPRAGGDESVARPRLRP